MSETSRVCVMCMAKCAPNMNEFIEHYLNVVKVDHVFWIDNNHEEYKVSYDDPRVTVIPYNNWCVFCSLFCKLDTSDDSMMNKLFNRYYTDDLKQGQYIEQETIYNDVYREYIYNNYDYAIVCDADEYLEINYDDIHDFIQNKFTGNIQEINFYYKTHKDNGYIYESQLPDAGCLKKNYGYAEDTNNAEYADIKIVFLSKYLFKCGSPDDVFLSMHQLYKVPDENKLFADFSDGVFHHYRCQCVESFLKNKFINGIIRKQGDGYVWSDIDSERDDTIKYHIFETWSTMSDVNAEKLYAWQKLLIRYDAVNLICDDDKEWMRNKCDEYNTPYILDSKTCVIVIIKDEHWMTEFIDHYLNIVGADHIFVCDNNIEEEMFTCDNPDVTVIPIHNVRLFNTYFNININQEHLLEKMIDGMNASEKQQNIFKCMDQVYTEKYQEYIQGVYDYVIVCDADEYLDIKGRDIHDFIKEYMEDKDRIDIQWRWHKDAGYIYESELPDYSSLKKSYGYDEEEHPEGWCTKYISRCRDGLILHIHTDSSADERVQKISIDTACIHHYQNKCLETFVKHKVINGMMRKSPYWLYNNETGKYDPSIFSLWNVLEDLNERKLHAILRFIKEYDIPVIPGCSDDRWLTEKCAEYGIEYKI